MRISARFPLYLLAVLLSIGLLTGCEPSPPVLDEPGASLREAPETKPLMIERSVEHPDSITEYHFENGLVLYVKENHASPVVATRVYVKVGSIYEDDMLGSGVSHYFEHVISGGSTRIRTEDESAKILKRIGNTGNAYTTRDHTAYYITTNTKNFPTAANLLGDYMANSRVKPEEFQRERGVIIQEIRKNRDNPYRTVYQMLSQAMFPDHPAGQPVIGHLDLFKKVSRADVLNFYRRFYVANNMIVVVAGDVPPGEAARTIGKTFSGVPRGSVNLPAIPSPPRQLGSRWAERESDSVRRLYLVMGHHTVPLDHPDLYALDVASDILGTGRTSRLYRALRDTGLVETVGSYSHTPSYDAGVFGISATLAPENLPKVLEAILAEISRIQSEPVGNAELQRAIRNRVTSQVYRLETIEAQASDIGGNVISAGDPSFTGRYLDGIRAVTPDAILGVMRKHMNAENRTIAILRPRREETKADAKDDSPETANENTGPTVERIELQSGLPLLYCQDPNVDSVYLRIAFRGGVLAENPGNNGVSQLMGTLLMRGTEKRDKDAFHEAAEDIGARIGSGSGNNSWYASVKVLPEHLSEGLGLLAEATLSPRFDPKDLKRERMLQLRKIAALDDSWQAEAQRFFRQSFFGLHPYAMHPAGTEKSVASLTRKDVRSFHQETLHAGAGVLCIFGNVGRDAAIQAATSAFQRIPLPSKPVSPPSRAELEHGKHVYLKANHKNQVVLVYGFPGEVFGGEDLPALTVLDAVISGYGYPSGWLHSALRGESDLVYFVHAYPWPGLGVGTFQIMTQTSAENLSEVRNRIDNVLKRIRTESVTKEELDSARESVIIADAIEHQSPESRAVQSGYDALYGVGYDYHDRFPERIRAVTADDVLRVAKKYLKNPVLCATGPASALDPLAPAAESNVDSDNTTHTKGPELVEPQTP